MRFWWMRCLIFVLGFKDGFSSVEISEEQQEEYLEISSGNNNTLVFTNASTEILIGDRLSVLVGTSITIKCPFKGNPYPRVTWFFNDRVINHVLHDNIDITEPEGVSVLRLLKVEPDLVGKYTCLAFNYYHRKTSHSFIRIVVPFQPTIFSERVSKQYTYLDNSSSVSIGTNVTVYDGTNITISCSVKSKYNYSMHWSLNNKVLLESQGVKRLQLSYISTNEAGVYRCHVNNLDGIGDVQMSVVSILERIYPAIETRNISVRYIRGSANALMQVGDEGVIKEGFTVKISCPFSALPLGKVTWERRGIKLFLPSGGVYMEEYLNRLVITNIQMKHTDLYTCVVDSPIGRSSASSNIIVIPKDSGPPRIKVSGNHHTVEIYSMEASSKVKIGENVRIVQGLSLKLQCKATGVPKPEISWEFNREPIRDESVIKTSNMLLIFSFEEKHVGEYKCNAKSLAGQTRAYSDVRIVVPKPPRITRGYATYKIADGSQPANIVIGDNLKTAGGRDITIRCQADGYPFSRLLWKHEQVMLMESDKIHLDNNAQSLMIKNSDQWDSGKYSCFASNGAGVSAMSSELKILAVGSPVITGMDTAINAFDDSPYVSIIIGTNLTTTTGKALRILCPSSGPNDTHYEWTINNDHLQYDSRINLGGKGKELIINDLQFFDEGVYECRAFTQYGFDDMKSLVKIIGTQDQGVENGNTSVLIDGGTISVLNQHSSKLKCVIRGSIRPRLRWLKDGLPIVPSNKISPRGEELVLQYADKNTAGRYTCIVTTPVGTIQTVTTVKVIEYVPVQIMYESKNILVTDIGKQVTAIIGSTIKAIIGVTIRLTCPHIASPKAYITWFHNGVEIGESLLFSYDLLNNALVIPKMTIDHIGVYMCVAEQIDKKDEAISNIDIIEMRRPIVKKSFNNISTDPSHGHHQAIVIGDTLIVNQGKQIDISCPGGGVPVPKVLWKFNGESIDKLKSVKVRDNGKVLVIMNALWEHSGRFECFLLNPIGFDYASSQVKVVGKFTPINFHPVDVSIKRLSKVYTLINVYVGTNATIRSENNIKLNCPVHIAGYVAIAWMKDGVLLGQQDRPAEGSLTLYDLQQTDSGTYTCFSKDQARIKFGNVNLKVIVPVKELIDRAEAQSIEYISKKQKQISIDVGTTITLLTGNSILFRCPVTHADEVTITWLHNGVKLEGQIQNTYKTLKLYEENTFKLTCLVTGVLGSEEVVSQVKVVAPKAPAIFSVEQDLISAKSHSIFDVGGRVKVLDGSSVDVNCPASGFPKPAVVWSYGEESLKDGDSVYFKGGGRVMSIRFVSEKHEGVYTCSVSNGFGNIVHRNIHIGVYEPKKPTIVQPKRAAAQPGLLSGPSFSTENIINSHTDSNSFLNSDSNLITRNVGEDYQMLSGPQLQLVCEVEGEPEPMVEWKKDGINLFNSLHYLLIDTTDLNNSGFYSCTAFNDFGATMERSKVTIEVPSKPVIQRDLNISNKTEIQAHMDGLTKVEVFIGDDLRTLRGTIIYLRCPSVGVPKPLITFYKDGVLIENNEIMHIDSSGSLLLNPTIGNTELSGVYVCHAENEAGFHEMKTEISIYEPIPPQFISTRSTPQYSFNLTTNKGLLKLTVGQNTTSYLHTVVQVKCPVMGFPFPDLIWHINGEVVSDDASVRFLDNSTTLVFEMVVQATTVFSCTATNMAGSESRRSVIELLRPLPSKILLPPFKLVKATGMTESITIGEDAKVLSGSTLTISCPSIGEPKPITVWELAESTYGWLETHPGINIDRNELHLLNVTKKFEGQYSCTASNVFGSNVKYSHIKVVEKVPTIIKSLKKRFVADPGAQVIQVLVGGELYIYENSRVSIDCPASGSPLPKVKWYKNNDVLLPAYLYDTFTNTLVLEKVKIEDGGMYTCEATNIANSAHASTLLSVGYKPTLGPIAPGLSPVISISEYSMVTVPIGVEEAFVRLDNTIVFQCFSKGYPSPNITWSYESYDIDYTHSQFYSPIPNTLHVRLLKRKNSGVYSCRSENAFGTVVRKTNLYIMEPPTIHQETDDVTVKTQTKETLEVVVGSMVTVVKGITLRLACPVTGSPPPDIRWLKNNGSFVLEERMFFTAEKDLKLIHAQPDDSGEYVCEAANKVGKTRSSTRLLVAEKPTASVFPNFRSSEIGKSSAVSSGNGKLIVPIGSHIRLFCQVTGSPPPRVVWLKGHDIVRRTQNAINQLELEVEFAAPKDAGSYVCMASNIMGEATAFMDVSMGAAPRVQKVNESFVSNQTAVTMHVGSSVAVYPGSVVTIVCETWGIPQPTVVWKMSSKDKNSLLTVQTSEPGTLHLRDVSYSNEGVYTCVAKNIIGSDMAFATLSIIDSATIVPNSLNSNDNEHGTIFFSKDNSYKNVIEGDTVQLLCDAIGYPLPFMQIQKTRQIAATDALDVLAVDNRQSTENEERNDLLNISITQTQRRFVHDAVRKPGVRSVYRINNVTLDHTSTYWCRATNDVGSDKTTLHLLVHKKPKHPYTGVWVSTRFGECSNPCVRSNYGQQFRQLKCLTYQGKTVDNSHCDPVLKLKSSRDCVTRQCETEWNPSVWTGCSAICGGSGVEVRRPFCMYRISKQKVGEENCPSETRPVSERTCNRYPCDKAKCVDEYQHCRMMKLTGFCRIEAYKTLCCESCVVYPRQ